MNIYDDDSLVKELTESVVAAGHSIFQIHRLANEDREHTRKLLEMFAPPIDGAVLDIGCGIGRVAELMSLERPDLEFTLFNVSAAQLEMCPKRFIRLKGDMHHIPISNEAYDAAMLCYSLGHGVAERALKEVSRVLRRNGVLFIYDMTSHPPRMLQNLGYTLFSPNRVCAAAEDYGLKLDWLKAKLKTTVTDFMSVMSAEEYEKTFAGVTPIAYRFIKC